MVGVGFTPTQINEKIRVYPVLKNNNYEKNNIQLKHKNGFRSYAFNTEWRREGPT